MTQSSPSPPPPSASAKIALVMMIAGLIAFVLVAADVVYHGRLERWDRPIQAALHHFAYPASNSPLPVDEWPFGACAFGAISALGGLVIIAPLALLVALFLAFHKKWRALIGWSVALCGSALINTALKDCFRIPRPTENTFYNFLPHSGYSFPSGHTMAVAITAGALAIVVIHLMPMPRARRRLLWSAAVFVSLLEGFALMYVGVHYLTDVLGALGISLAWLGIIRRMLRPAGPLSA